MHIQPGNVLLSSDIPPVVRLADFGLSIMKQVCTVYATHVCSI